MKRLWSGARSLLFYAGYIPVVFVFSVLAFSLGWLLPFRPRQTLITSANGLIILWLRITCGVRLNVIGRENIPQGPCVVLSKHQSSWETYFLQRLFRPASTLLKKELLYIPFFGWGLAMTRPIAIDRSNPREALKQVLALGKQRLAEGNNLVIYPEGTRTKPGQVGNYGRSGAAIAIAAQVPIVPVAHNAGHCWPAHRFIKNAGTITVVIGPPVATTNRDSKELTEQVQHWIETALDSHLPLDEKG